MNVSELKADDEAVAGRLCPNDATAVGSFAVLVFDHQQAEVANPKFAVDREAQSAAAYVDGRSGATYGLHDTQRGVERPAPRAAPLAQEARGANGAV